MVASFQLMDVEAEDDDSLLLLQVGVSRCDDADGVGDSELWGEQEAVVVGVFA